MDQDRLDRPGAYGDAFAEVYDAWYADLGDAEAPARWLAHESGPQPRRVLELGVGTGRLAGPLRRRGHVVIGLDASTPMLRAGGERLVAATDGLVQADMARLPVADASVDVVLCGFNTIFNLAEAEAQRWTVEEAARVLRTGGRAAFELVATDRLDPGLARSRRPLPGGGEVEIETEVDAATRRVRGVHRRLGPGGEVADERRWLVRWCTPAEIGRWGEGAGLTVTHDGPGWPGAGPDEAADRVVILERPRRADREHPRSDAEVGWGR